MAAATVGEVRGGLWRFEALHPEWTEQDRGDGGWEPLVAWWAVSSSAGLLLIDPLVNDWPSLDGLVEAQGGCAGVIRTLPWHERSVAEAAARYGAAVWAKPPPPPEREWAPFSRDLDPGDETPGGLRACDVGRTVEVALWLPRQAALLFGDAMLRRSSGELYRCPDDWLEPDEEPARLRAALAGLGELPVQHVLVCHGPLVFGDGAAALRNAVA